MYVYDMISRIKKWHICCICAARMAYMHAYMEHIFDATSMGLKLFNFFKNVLYLWIFILLIIEHIRIVIHREKPLNLPGAEPRIFGLPSETLNRCLDRCRLYADQVCLNNYNCMHICYICDTYMNAPI